MAKRGRTGLTLIENAFAMAVLSVALLGLVGGVTQSMRSAQVSRDRTIAMHAAQSKLEELRQTKFDEIYAAYALSREFMVEALDPTRPAGRIEFPEEDGRLSEAVRDAALGMPRDLNGNGSNGIDKPWDGDVSAGYRLLPVRIVIEWEGAGGRTRYVTEAFLVP